MGYLFHILLALGAVGLAEGLGPVGPRLPIGAALLCVVPHLLGLVARRLALAGRFRLAAAAMHLVSWSPPALQLVAVLVFGWHACALEWTGAETALLGWPEPLLLLSLLPYATYALLAIDARARLGDSDPRAIAARRRFQVRMFLSGVVPLTLYVLLAWSVGFDPDLRVLVEEVALYNALFAASLLAVFALFLPRILRNTWETTALEPGLARSVLEAVAHKAEFRCRELLVWRTGNLMANAAIVGLTRWQRVVLFSDALLMQLHPRQLAAVFAHEIGHAKRHHVPVFAAWALAFFLAGDLAITALDPESELAGLGLFALFLGLWYLSFGYLSRRFELDADLVSVEVTGDTEALVSALDQVSGVHARRVKSWRHFSSVERILFLRAVARDPAAGERLRRSLRRWSRLGVGLFVLAGLGQLAYLASSLDQDRIVADLRLGRYEEAERRAGDGEGLEPELVALVVRAAEVREASEVVRAGDGLEPEHLEGAAVAAMRRGDPTAARECLELAVLRGRDDLYPPVRALRAHEEGDAEAVDEWLGESEAPWPKLFELLVGGGESGGSS